MSGAAVGYAAGAAMFLALGSALQHHAAAGEQGYRNGLDLLWRLARNRRWVAGLGAGAAGFVMHTAALHAGALAVVQTVLVSGLALALPTRVLMDRAPPPAGQVLAAVALAAGVAVFVMAANPRAGQPAPDGRGAAAAIAAGAVLAGACSAVAARARSGRLAGFALGVAAGVLYGLAGGALKAAVHTAEHDPLAALSGWALWTLIALGGWGFIAHQRAYTHAPLGVSLPVLSVANPLAGIAIGVLAFGETLASRPLALAGQAAGMAVIIISVTILARTGPTAGRHRAPRSDGPSRQATARPAPQPPSGTEPPGAAARPGATAPRAPAVTTAWPGRDLGMRVSDPAGDPPPR